METGSIAKWNLNVGDRFEPGSSLCDVETDKATVSFDAQEEGYIAKILITSGDIKVGQPLLVTVDEAEDVAAFANFTVGAAPAPSAPVAAPSAPSSSTPKSTPAPVTTSHNSSSSNSNNSSGRIFASPLAKKLVREAGDDLSRVASVLGGGQNGSGYSGRIVAADVVKALQVPRAAAAVAAPAPVAAAAPAKAAATKPVSVPQIAGVFQDFTVTDEHAALSARLAHSKHSVPHYYLSVELNLQKLLQLRSQLNTLNAPPKGKGDAAANSNSGIAVLDLLVKAAAQTMRTVPDLNAAWMDSFVRQYHQVDINVVMSSQNTVVTPVVRDVAGRGLAAVSSELAALEGRVAAGEALSEQETAEGTFTVHNLGVYGVRSAAPILLPPQAAALSLGAINDVVVPRASPAEGEDVWEVAPVMVVTLVCDHRVVDGAVSAQWLSAFKNNVENPVNLLM